MKRMYSVNIRFLLNEKEMIEEIINTGKLEGKVYDKKFSAIKRIAKYYISQGMDENEIEKNILLWLKKYMPIEYNRRDAIIHFVGDNDYNKYDLCQCIRYLIRQADRTYKPYITIDSINITENELEAIKGVNNDTLKKVLFGYIIWNKILIKRYGGEYINSRYTNQIFKMIGIYEKKNFRQKYGLLRKLQDLGLIKIYRNCGIYVNVEEGGDVVMTVTDLTQSLGLQYDKYIVPSLKTKKCECCGRLFMYKTKREKYCCEVCKKKADREKAKQRMRKLRS